MFKLANFNKNKSYFGRFCQMNHADCKHGGCVDFGEMVRRIMSRLRACMPCSCGGCPNSCTVSITVSRKEDSVPAPRTHPATTIRNELHEEFRCKTPPIKTKDASQQTDVIDVDLQRAAVRMMDTDSTVSVLPDTDSQTSDADSDVEDDIVVVGVE